MVKEKECERCGETKPTTDFRPKIADCKTCEKDPNYLKECSKCLRKLPKARFGNGRICHDCKKGNWRVCLGCQENMTTAYYRRGQKICKECEAKGVDYEKTCKICQEVKSVENFRFNRMECLDCERSNGREYRKTTTKAKEWSDANKERMKELQSRWYEENKPLIRQREKERKEVDPIFRTIKHYRSGLVALLKGAIKKSKWLTIDHKTFYSWISHNFEEDMDMDNYGEIWQVDHVLPLELLYEKKKNSWCSDILKEEDAMNCVYSWYNTCPLYSTDNRLKSQDINYKTLSLHLKTLVKYMKENDLPFDEEFVTYRKVVRKILDCF